LHPAEVELHAGLKAGKALQRDLHAAEAELLEQRVQKRFEHKKPSRQFRLMPCPTCIELLTGMLYEAWVREKSTLAEKCVLCPLLAVVFEADELPPTYTCKGGKWTLAQGVGPKTLEIKVPNRLPAAQFKVLLPTRLNPIRPPCWGESKESKDGRGPRKDEDTQEVWDQRNAIIDSVSEALEDSDFHSVAIRVEELCAAVAEAWEALEKPKAQGRSKCGGAKTSESGATYIKVPALAVPDEARPVVDSWLYGSS